MTFSGRGKSQLMLVSAHPANQIKPCLFIHIEHGSQMPQEPEVKEKAHHLRNHRQAFAKKSNALFNGCPFPFYHYLVARQL